MAAVSMGIAVAALLFTVTSFWWLNARRGGLLLLRSFTWAGYTNPVEPAAGHKTFIRLPLALANPGPVDIVVVDLRVKVRHAGGTATLRWDSERSTLRPAEDDFVDFASQLVVPGREAIHRNIVFGGHGSEPVYLAPGQHFDVDVEVKYSWANKRAKVLEWRLLATIPITGPDEGSPYIAHPTADRYS